MAEEIVGYIVEFDSIIMEPDGTGFHDGTVFSDVEEARRDAEPNQSVFVLTRLED